MTSLTITPGAVGTDKMFICGFEFTSGSTHTVLTLTGCTLSNSDDVPLRIRDKVKQELIRRGREDLLGGE